MRPIITNATLLKIEGGSFAQDGRRPRGAATSKWDSADTAPEPVFVEDRNRVVVGDGGQTREREVTVLLDGQLARQAGVEPGDTVTYQLGNDAPVARLVRELDTTDTLGSSVDCQLYLAVD